MQFESQKNNMEFYSSSEGEDEQFEQKIMFCKKVFGGGGQGAKKAENNVKSMLGKRKNSQPIEEEPKNNKKRFWD